MNRDVLRTQPHVARLRKPTSAGNCFLAPGRLSGILTLCLWLMRSAQAGGVVGGCTEQALRIALLNGGVVSFTNDCSITLSAPINIGAGGSTIINSGGYAVTISGGNSIRLFNVTGTLQLVGLTLANGSSQSGGALYVNAGATAIASNCTFTANTASGVTGANGSTGSNSSTGTGGRGGDGGSGTAGLGGAIYNAGTVGLLSCTLVTNGAVGGNGGNGGTGGSGGGSLSQGGDGGAGGVGASGLGGAVYNLGNLSLFNCTISTNSAQGGNGGIGGTNGPGNFPGLEGTGAAGASGAGGAIYNARNVSIIACTFNGNTANGGNSAAGGNRTSGVGTTGNRGGDGIGGALCSIWWGGVTNCTFYNNEVAGGTGGNGGDGSSTINEAGNGGDGGNGFGGAIENENTLTLLNCTVANCAASGGTNGVAGAGFGGTDGNPGQANGGGLARTAGTLFLMNSILATNAPGANSYGSVTDSGYNVSSDSSFTAGATSRVNIDAGLGPLANNGGPTMTMALLAGSPAINLIPSDSGTFPPTDERGVTRPQGNGADVGAYELAIGNIITNPPTLLQPTVQSGRIAVVFLTSPAGIYVLQYENDPTSATWIPLSTNIGTGGLVTNLDLITNQNRFYRVFVR